jgi:hypothetical protein
MVAKELKDSLGSFGLSVYKKTKSFSEASQPKIILMRSFGSINAVKERGNVDQFSSMLKEVSINNLIAGQR